MDAWIVVYGTALLLASTTAVVRRKTIVSTDRILAVLLVLTVIQEGIAYLLVLRKGNNLFTYHIYSPIELSLLCIYLAKGIPFLRSIKRMTVLVAAALVAGVVNTTFLQSIHAFNSNYQLFESSVIISLCLLSFYATTILAPDGLEGYRKPRFWFVIILFLYWSATFLGWGVFNLSRGERLRHFSVVFSVLNFSNIFLYTTLAFVFLFYRRIGKVGTTLVA